MINFSSAKFEKYNSPRINLISQLLRRNYISKILITSFQSGRSLDQRRKIKLEQPIKSKHSWQGSPIVAESILTNRKPPDKCRSRGSLLSVNSLLRFQFDGTRGGGGSCLTRVDQKFSRRLFVSETFYSKAVLQPAGTLSSSSYLDICISTRANVNRLVPSFRDFGARRSRDKFDCRHSQFACHVAGEGEKCRCRNDVSSTFWKTFFSISLFSNDDDAFCACWRNHRERAEEKRYTHG